MSGSSDSGPTWPPHPEPAPPPRKLPSPPPDLRPRGPGRRFWRQILELYELRHDELELLAEVCRQIDLLERLRSEIADGDLVVNGKVHPLVVEQRLRLVELRRALAQLALPDADDDGRITDEVRTARSVRARKAALRRWSNGGL